MADGDAVTLGREQTEETTTTITRTPLVHPFFEAFDSGVVVKNRDGFAVEGFSDDRIGIRGATATGTGVFGIAQVIDGEANGTGVRGFSNDGVGVVGEARVTGVLGRSAGTGVHAISNGDIGEAVVASCNEGTGVRAFGGRLGVWGRTNNGRGLYGLAQVDGGVGVYGEANSLEAAVNGIGVYGTAGQDPNVGGLAAKFDGPVLVNGSFMVHGPKAAAVPLGDELRLMYSVESTESWFEDFGSGEIINGRGRVTLDPEFASIIDTEDYHVFLTPKGDSDGLFISAQYEDAFEVQEQRAGTSSLAFSYRVVGRRNDIPRARLGRLPKLPETPRELRIDDHPSAPDIRPLSEEDGLT